MIFEPLEHRSDDWYKKRLGMPTASQFHRIVTLGGKAEIPGRSKMAERYIGDLVAERIFKRSMQKDISYLEAVKWGVEHEDKAAALLEEHIGPLQPGGFMTDRPQKPRYGASPDRILAKGNRREVCEIKCPFEIPRHVKNLLFGADTEHWPQLQGQLLISGYECVHFYSYHPDCPPYYERVPRDEVFINNLRDLLDKFCAELDEAEMKARRMGGWKGVA